MRHLVLAWWSRQLPLCDDAMANSATLRERTLFYSMAVLRKKFARLRSAYFYSLSLVLLEKGIDSCLSDAQPQEISERSFMFAASWTKGDCEAVRLL